MQVEYALDVAFVLPQISAHLVFQLLHGADQNVRFQNVLAFWQMIPPMSAQVEVLVSLQTYVHHVILVMEVQCVNSQSALENSQMQPVLFVLEEVFVLLQTSAHLVIHRLNGLVLLVKCQSASDLLKMIQPTFALAEEHVFNLTSVHHVLEVMEDQCVNIQFVMEDYLMILQRSVLEEEHVFLLMFVPIVTQVTLDRIVNTQFVMDSLQMIL